MLPQPHVDVEEEILLLHSIPASACRITLAASSPTPAGVIAIELVVSRRRASKFARNARRKVPQYQVRYYQPQLTTAVPPRRAHLVVRRALVPIWFGLTVSCLPDTT